MNTSPGTVATLSLITFVMLKVICIGPHSSFICVVIILPVYVLRTYFYFYRYAYVLLHDQLSTLNRLFGCFPGMTTSLAKSKQITGGHFQTPFRPILRFFTPQGCHVAPMGVKFGTEEA